MQLTQERLKHYLHYEPETGIFTWLNVNINTPKSKIGMRAGRLLGSIRNTNDNRYLVVNLDHTMYRLHNLAFLYMTGSFPKETVDHINLDKLDNRWNNLREATVKENSYNRKVQADSTTGVKGLYERKGAWQVRVMVNAKAYTILFTFEKYEGAEAAKSEALLYLRELRQQLHGEFANHG